MGAPLRSAPAAEYGQLFFEVGQRPGERRDCSRDQQHLKAVRADLQRIDEYQRLAQEQDGSHRACAPASKRGSCPVHAARRQAGEQERQRSRDRLRPTEDVRPCPDRRVVKRRARLQLPADPPDERQAVSRVIKREGLVDPDRRIQEEWQSGRQQCNRASQCCQGGAASNGWGSADGGDQGSFRHTPRMLLPSPF